MIAFYGTGLLGAGFVRAALKRGEQVQVWNRTPEKARALVAEGAIAFDDPAPAARGATRVHTVLSDDAAVDEVLERAKAGFAAGVSLVDHTTTSPAGTVARVSRWAERGMCFQHAPVFMGPQNALEATGIMLASGDRARFDALAPELAKMTGKLVYMGPAPERAAAFKLLGNLFLMFLTAGVSELFSLAKAVGIPAPEAAKLFDTFNPGMLIGPRAKRMIAGEFENASWELSKARKDARLMMEAGKQGGVPLEMLPAIAAVMDKWIERGHGHDDWTVIAKDAVSR